MVTVLMSFHNHPEKRKSKLKGRRRKVKGTLTKDNVEGKNCTKFRKRI
jgi:hypothetical protein